VLHVGLMKSGTSYLQRRLFAGRDALREAGVLVPGQRWRDQVLAVSDVLGRAAAGPSARGRWDALLSEVGAHRGTALVSMEFLGPAPPERIAALLGSLAPARVEAVLTLRDLGRAVPAMWQEALQHGSSVGWGEYVAGLGGARRPARAFWRQQGMARIAGNWVDALGSSAVTLVTVPPPGHPPEQLWHRFCLAAGIDGSACPQVGPANTSLDAASARVLLELNRVLAPDGLERATYHREVKFRLAKNAMAGRDAAPIGFVPPPWLVDRAAEIGSRLRDTGAGVVGDLDELRPIGTTGADPDALEDATVARAAIDALRRRVLLDVHRGVHSTRGATMAQSEEQRQNQQGEQPSTDELKAGMREALDRKEPHTHPDDSPEVGDHTRESEVVGPVSQEGVNRRGGRAGGQPA
jgi:hypothetical protein